MGDSFFVSDKKRKRPARAGPSSGRGRGRGGGGRGGGGGGGSRQPRRDDRDDDVSDASSDAGGGDFDTMDFRAGREEIPLSDGEAVDENETAAEKRVRLAKGYLAKVREDLEAGEFSGSRTWKCSG
jgi:ribosomal RNA-processing protein 9